MEYKLLITKEAENDIDEIVAYIVNVLKNPIEIQHIFCNSGIIVITKKTFLAKNIDEGNIIPSDIGIFNNTYFNYHLHIVLIEVDIWLKKLLQEFLY